MDRLAQLVCALDFLDGPGDVDPGRSAELGAENGDHDIGLVDALPVDDRLRTIAVDRGRMQLVQPRREDEAAALSVTARSTWKCQSGWLCVQFGCPRARRRGPGRRWRETAYDHGSGPARRV